MASNRYVHKLETIAFAMEELPSADYWPKDIYEVEIDRRTVVFRKVKFKDSSGKAVRWIYEGKILVK